MDAPARASTPWSGLEIVFALLIVVWFWPKIVLEGLRATDFFVHVYGQDVLQQAQAKEDSPARNLAQTRVQIWLNLLTLPLQVLSVPLMLQTRPGRLGLTLRHFWGNLRLGLLAALVLIPLVHGINLGVVILHQVWLQIPVEAHPVMALRADVRPFEWVVLILSTMVAAPVLEELLFRGMLQPWFASWRGGGLLAAAYALLMVAIKRADGLMQHWGVDWGKVVLELAPALFVLAMTPLVVLLGRWCRTPVQSAIFGTSLLFAAAHASVWPSPIPLLVLALGLGWLAQRTGSLVAPIVVHALFNGLACLMFWVG